MCVWGVVSYFSYIMTLARKVVHVPKKVSKKTFKSSNGRFVRWVFDMVNLKQMYLFIMILSGFHVYCQINCQTDNTILKKLPLLDLKGFLRLFYYHLFGERHIRGYHHRYPPPLKVPPLGGSGQNFDIRKILYKKIF